MSDDKKKKRGVGNQGCKANKATVHYRVSQIYQELKLCKSKSDIKRKLSEAWGITERCIENYIAKAQKHIELDFDIDRHDFLLK